MTGYAEWIKAKRDQQISTAGGLPHSRPKDYVTGEGRLPFNRRRIIALAIRDHDYLERWIADPNTPDHNLDLFKAKLPHATINRDRARKLLAKLPPEWTGPAQPTMI